MMKAVVFAFWAIGAPGAQLGEPEAPPEMRDPVARRHFVAGMKAWLAEDFPTALSELEAAYERDPVPVLLYSLGQLERLEGDCDRARERFLAYLDTHPTPAATEDTLVNLERCRAHPSSEVPQAVPAPAPVSEVAPAPEVASRELWRRDRLGIGLTAAGSALTLLGVGLFGGAFAEQRRVEARSDIDGFARGIARARGEYWSGVGLISAGVAVLVGGVVRVAWVRKRSRRVTARR